jgi:hypothetical protein
MHAHVYAHTRHTPSYTRTIHLHTCIQFRTKWAEFRI